ncbi:hypothetical protein LJB91_01270 [Bacteroidales bacterium OttesenSCG-928-L03]|nr:hypothetical protein [Bacteroidales bacterium OttesenSCG-928-L03]
MEDLAVAQGEDCLRIAYSDNQYRGPVRGTFEVIRTLLDGPADIPTDIHLLVQEKGIPQVLVRIPADLLDRYYRKEIALSGLLQEIEISYDTRSDELALKGSGKLNSSFGKVDLVLYPQVQLTNSWYDKIYGAVFNLAPTLEIDLWKGASFTGQVIFPLWNNMTGEMDYIRAGMLVFRQEYRFPRNIFTSFSVGNFNERRMGMDLTAYYRSDNGRWMAGGNAGLTGSSTFYEGNWEVYRWRRVSGSLFLQYNEPFYGLQLDLAAHHYIYGDEGVRLDCSRHFGKVAIGFYGMYSGGEVNGGFHFAVPISPKKLPRRRALRIRLPEYFDWEYEAQSGKKYTQKKLGRYYETRPDENRSQRHYIPESMKKRLVEMAQEEWK